MKFDTNSLAKESRSQRIPIGDLTIDWPNHRLDTVTKSMEMIMEPRLSVNRVLDVLIRRLRKEATNPNNCPTAYQKHYALGFRHAVRRIEDYRRALHEAFPQLRSGKD